MDEKANLNIVAAGPQDRDSLWLMLTFAASMGQGGADQVAAAQADPYLRGYVENWGQQAGELGFIARPKMGPDVGAAWLRTPEKTANRGERPVPELALGVLPDRRGQGIGTLLMDRLIAAARTECEAIVLSVRQENAAVRLYRRLGFVETGRLTNRVGGVSLAMRLELGQA
ncbi:MAG: GNAT family N-acetyltransferase [Candidatus Latescibacteria bacterium]|nr:GNAT family N-acetyltransferase [Candidatus Latescibacterota bacterium]